jgi:uncharacterized protein (UPF0248 family)
MERPGRTAREVLNRLMWDPSAGGMEGVVVVIRHRGAAMDEKSIPAGYITSAGKGSFETSEATIPYHRVLRICRGDAILFERRKGPLARP